jgi:hypothetical protein
MKKLKRTGSFVSASPIEKVFPLLCPKREEEWIPGWEAETIWSESGCNEEGAIFRTLKPYGSELYWTTLRFDIRGRTVDFFITAPGLYVFRFIIRIEPLSDTQLKISFDQEFTPVSASGDVLLRRIEAEDFNGRLKDLEKYMADYLK